MEFNSSAVPIFPGDDDDVIWTPYYPLEYRVLASIVNLLIFVFGVAGNVVVIVAVARTRNLQSPTYTYLVLTVRWIQ